MEGRNLVDPLCPLVFVFEVAEMHWILGRGVRGVSVDPKHLARSSGWVVFWVSWALHAEEDRHESRRRQNHSPPNDHLLWLAVGVVWERVPTLM